MKKIEKVSHTCIYLLTWVIAFSLTLGLCIFCGIEEKLSIIIANITGIVLAFLAIIEEHLKVIHKFIKDNYGEESDN